MGVLARLSGTAVEVEPGARVTVDLSVRNTGTVVDQFTFEVLGPTAAWAVVEPAAVSLFPQAEQTVQVTFSPPRAPATPAGTVPFGVRVLSREDPQGGAVEEGTVTVAPFSEVVAELVPRATRARRRGRLQVLVDNRSNIAYRAELLGTDGDGAFDYVFRPPLVDVGAGTVAFTKLTVRAKYRYWRGPSTTQAFQVLLRQQVVAVPEGEPPPEPAGPHPADLPADGAILRDPILPGWLAKVALLALVLLLLLALAWFKLVKPQITAAAQNSVTKAIKPIKQEIGTIKEQLPPNGAPVTAPPPAGGGGTTTTTAPPTTTKPSPTTSTTTPRPTTTTPRPTTTTTRPKPHPAKVVTPINYSLSLDRNNAMAVYGVPRHQTLEVTDILLENSDGASGNIYLERSGQVLMSWSLANFRDLDYHWITPIYFDSRTQLQLSVKHCSNVCTPSLYFAGNLVTAP